METIKVLIADDNLFTAKLVSSYLKSNRKFNIIGIASDGIEAIQMLKEKAPDILLLDMILPKRSGLECLEIINNEKIEVKVLSFSACISAEIVNKAIKLGACGFIGKDEEPKKIAQAIKEIDKTGSYFCSRSINSIVGSIQDTNDNEELEVSIAYDSLTAREKQILNFAERNLSSRDISDELYISLRTVETHRKNILKKTCSKTLNDFIEKLKKYKKGELD